MGNQNTVLRLGFITDTERNSVLAIKNPAIGLSDTDVAEAMDAMIASGAISEKNGVISVRKYARLVTTSVTDIELPA